MRTKIYQSYLDDILHKVDAYLDMSERRKKLLIELFDFCAEYGGIPRKEFIFSIDIINLLLKSHVDERTIILGMMSGFLYNPQGKKLFKPFWDKFCPDTKKTIESICQLRGFLESEHHSNYKQLQKVMVSQSSDFRVLLLIIIQRVIYIRRLAESRLSPEEIKNLCSEAMEVHIPLASRLGLYEIKNEIEDLSIKYLKPKMYRGIAAQLGHKKREREEFLQHAIKEISDFLTKNHIKNVKVDGRIKNIYSIYKKIKKKHYNTINEVYDLIALRIIVENQATCYQVLGLIHSRWTPLHQKFKDYIAIPKPNGYQSIHTTLLGLAHRKLPTEIQIRSKQMHQYAEFGVAAHWAYKGVNTIDSKDALELSPHDIASASFKKQFDAISSSLKKDRILVFTPSGDIHHLPQKSTPVDFAYAIHSDIGDACSGAKINNLIKPLNYQLQRGDVVEILTQKGKNPNPDWIKSVKTGHAKGHIKRYINKKREELEQQIFIKKEPDADNEQKILENISSKKLAKNKDIASVTCCNLIIGGESGLPYKLASCCIPVCGQSPVIAISNRGLAFSVHRVDCETFAKQKTEDSMILEAYSLITKKLEILAENRSGLLGDLAIFLKNEDINVMNMAVESNCGRTKIHTKISLSVEVRSEREFQYILQQIPEIISVETVTEIR